MKVNRILPWVLGGFMAVLLAAPLLALTQEGGNDFTREELAQMVAPVALYPDALLSQVLMAATYPLEVVEADRWVKNNPLLRGDNLDAALRNQDWDASVKALCHVPAVLGVMSERLTDTTRLGDAFLAQEKEVMATIQDLRARARREGNLNSDDKQRVTVGEDGIIVIASADTKLVYVPYYNTSYVYGPWWYPAWPPWYWGPGEVVLGTGIYFWPDFYFGFGFGFGYWSHFDWYGSTIVIDYNRPPPFFRADHGRDHHDGSWHHDPSHRRGVVYHDRGTAEQFGQPPARVERADRQSTKGKVRGPVTSSGGSRSSAEVRSKSATPESADHKNAARLPGAGGDNSPAKAERRRGGVVSAPGVEVSPKVESTTPGPVNRGNNSPVSRDVTSSREVSSDSQGGDGAGMESRYERRGGSAREGRQSGSQEHGVGEKPDGPSRGGRR